LRQALDHPANTQGLILHEPDQDAVASLGIHDPHDQDQNDENGTDNRHRNGLQKELILLPETVLPDHFSIRTHKTLKK
jgi:hypothetical protein